MQKSEFLNPENWYGSYYELAIEYPKGDHLKSLNALNSIWQNDKIVGPWSKKDAFGSTSQLVEYIHSDKLNQYYGWVQFDTYKPIGCLTLTVLEADNDGSDWICFCIPTGMLELAFEVEYPLLLNTNPWLHTIDQFFLQCAIVINEISPFDLAIIGEAVSGFVHSSKITPDILQNGGYILSKELVNTLEMDLAPTVLSKHLR